MKKDWVAAVDIGGTKTLVGVVDRKGAILRSKRIETDISLSGEEHVTKCVELAVECLQEEGLAPEQAAGVGLTVPGLADTAGGRLVYAPYAGWRDVPVREIVSRRFPAMPVGVANDVNACALGELWFGHATAYDSFLWATISTGIGGGLVVRRSIYEGEHGIAGELGHIVVEWDKPRRCGCGNVGCLEAHASGTAIGAMARDALAEEGGDGPLARFLRAQGLSPEPNAASLAKAAEAGVETAQRIFDSAGMYIGRAFAAAVNLLNPGVIFVGGGVSLSFPLMERAVREAIGKSVIGNSNRNVPILRTGLGYEAGLLGAASLAWQALKHREEQMQ